MRSVPFLLSVLALTALPSLESLAQADEPLPTAPEESTAAASASARTSHWYGWQPLMTDAGSIALLIAGARVGGAGGETLAILGAGSFVFASPMIHLGHEHPDKALGSLALRLLVPAGALFTGLLVGLVAGDASGANDQRGGNVAGPVFGAAIGGFTGTVLTVVIDAAAIASEPVRPAPSAEPPAEAHATIEPRVGAVRGGATLGIGGTF
jgi:hypothetical protein